MSKTRALPSMNVVTNRILSSALMLMSTGSGIAADGDEPQLGDDPEPPVPRAFRGIRDRCDGPVPLPAPECVLGRTLVTAGLIQIRESQQGEDGKNRGDDE